jgi:hypothetical protein
VMVVRDVAIDYLLTLYQVLARLWRASVAASARRGGSCCLLKSPEGSGSSSKAARSPVNRTPRAQSKIDGGLLLDEALAELRDLRGGNSETGPRISIKGAVFHFDFVEHGVEEAGVSSHYGPGDGRI